MKFYTYPPNECKWPWILRNIKQKPQLHCCHEIVDIGIYDLLKPPYIHSDDKLDKWIKLRTVGWKVVPDCPDVRREFKGRTRSNINNIDYSKELLREYYDPNDPQHLPVIQSYFKDIKSYRDYINWFKNEYPEPSKIGIGSVCKMDDNKMGLEILKIAREEFPNSLIHVFGLRLIQFKWGYKYIDSFDSTSWTFPRKKGLPSAKNKEVKIDYFKDYLMSVDKKMGGDSMLQSCKVAQKYLKNSTLIL